MKNMMLKNFALTTLAGVGLILFSAQAGLATTFYLQQKDDFGDIALSGQFSGEDINNNSLLSLDELTSFDLSTYGNPVYTLENFTSFFYALDGNQTISFIAEKTEDINDGTILYIDYFLSVDSESDPITFGSDTTYLTDGSIIIGDIFSTQPVQVSTAQVPEGNNIIALSVLGFLALLQKQRKT